MSGQCPRDRVLELVENGQVSQEYALLACLKSMSWDDVRDMAHANEIGTQCPSCAAINLFETCDTCEEGDDDE